MPSALNGMVCEYLQTCGFSKTATVFEEELKNEVGLQDSVDALISQIFQHIDEFAIDKLLDLWRFLHTRVFATLSEAQTKVASDLENAVYKLYVIMCVKHSRQDKVHEFFSRIANFARSAEWAEWFSLPYVKNPAQHRTFEKYFLPHWQACLIVWLHNFLSIAFQQGNKPRLVVCVEKGLARSEPSSASDGSRSQQSPSGFDTGLTDDFAVIAQCGTPGSKTSSKSLKTIFKNIAGK